MVDAPKHDEDIASELNVKATIVRTILNDLHKNSLVEYDRSKNKKTGWYTYKWKRREEEKVLEYVKEYLEQKLSKLTENLNYEKSGTMFSCSCRKVPFDIAMESEFVCPKCNDRYEEFDNSDEIDRLVSEMAEVKELLELT